LIAEHERRVKNCKHDCKWNRPQERINTCNERCTASAVVGCQDDCTAEALESSINTCVDSCK